MQIEAQSIMNGNCVGNTVWICHYLRPDLGKKPLRNLPPTKVIVCSNDELPSNKTIYYSKNHFRPFLKSGEPSSSKFISPVDNTGFRQRSGNTLFVFNNENECDVEWNKQIDEVCDRLTVLIDNQTGVLLLERDRLQGSRA